MLKQYPQRWKRLLGQFGNETRNMKQAKELKPSPIWADSSHSWPLEQSHHLGKLDLCQHAASAVCWGMGEEGGNVWAAGFYHKAFSLRKAYNEFPRHDITQYFKWLTVQRDHVLKNKRLRCKRPTTTWMKSDATWKHYILVVFNSFH